MLNSCVASYKVSFRCFITCVGSCEVELYYLVSCVVLCIVVSLVFHVLIHLNPVAAFSSHVLLHSTSIQCVVSHVSCFHCSMCSPQVLKFVCCVCVVLICRCLIRRYCGHGFRSTLADDD